LFALCDAGKILLDANISTQALPVSEIIGVAEVSVELGHNIASIEAKGSCGLNACPAPKLNIRRFVTNCGRGSSGVASLRSVGLLLFPRHGCQLNSVMRFDGWVEMRSSSWPWKEEKEKRKEINSMI
jgi:hypothetical protein